MTYVVRKPLHLLASLNSRKVTNQKRIYYHHHKQDHHQYPLIVNDSCFSFSNIVQCSFLRDHFSCSRLKLSWEVTWYISLTLRHKKKKK